MESLEVGFSVLRLVSAWMFEERAAFSAATMDKGRLREGLDDCEFGRRCQLKPLAREPPRVGDPAPVVVLLLSPSRGETFSLEGETGCAAWSSIDSARVTSLVGELAGASMGEESSLRCPELRLRLTDGGGVFAGDDFWGEMDLARSATKCKQSWDREAYNVSKATEVRDGNAGRIGCGIHCTTQQESQVRSEARRIQVLTFATSLSLFAILQDLLLQSSIFLNTSIALLERLRDVFGDVIGHDLTVWSGGGT
jgi:hypothetical protein